MGPGGTQQEGRFQQSTTLMIEMMQRMNDLSFQHYFNISKPAIRFSFRAFCNFIV